MKVTSWNTEGRLSRVAKAGERGSPEQILQEIERLDSDVIFLPEAFDGASPMERDVEDRLRRLGYELFTVAYSDQGEKKYALSDDTHMMILSRLEILQRSELVLVGGIRNMLTVDVASPETGEPVRFFGVHLDDRSEDGRRRQVDDLLPRINASSVPTVVMGDFNAMRARSLPAHVLRSRIASTVIDVWPEGETKHTLERMSQMAIGKTMQRFETETNLLHTDVNMRPTITPKARGHEGRPSVRMMQIDFILTSPLLESNSFTVERDGGADHRAISASLRVTRQKS